MRIDVATDNIPSLNRSGESLKKMPQRYSRQLAVYARYTDLLLNRSAMFRRRMASRLLINGLTTLGI